MKDIYIEVDTIERVNAAAEEGYVVDQVYIIPMWESDRRGFHAPEVVYLMKLQGTR